jgi:hypothetical protein
MKNLICTFVLLISTNAFAQNIRAQELRLSKLLGTKTLTCKPSDHRKALNAKYRGDDGFFSIRVVQGHIQISKNGGYGFGFGNGNVRDLYVGNEDLFLSVGDDGYQNLTLHIADFGKNETACAEGRMISYFDGFHDDDKKNAETCCLK